MITVLIRFGASFRTLLENESGECQVFYQLLIADRRHIRVRLCTIYASSPPFSLKIAYLKRRFVWYQFREK